MKKQTLIMGMCGFMMTNVLLATPSSSLLNQAASAGVVRNSPSMSPTALHDLERGTVGESCKTQDAHAAISNRAKVMAITGLTGMFVALAAYVHLY